MRIVLRRLRVAVAVALGALAIGMPSAQAHVTVQPGIQEQGGYGTLSFKTPNERSAASTVRIVVQFPLDTALASVSVKPHPGWSYSVQKAKLSTPIDSHGKAITEAVEQIEWTADSPKTGIQPGEYDEFSVSAGPFPSADRMVFKVTQTYSDGEVVRWIQDPQPGAEPERPAPVLVLAPKAASADPAPRTGGIDSTSSGSSWAGWLSGSALAVSLLVAAWVAVDSRRRRAGRPAEAARDGRDADSEARAT